MKQSYKYDNCVKAFIKGNFGDDIFIHILCDRYPEQKFIVCGEQRFRQLFKDIKNLTYISRDSSVNKWLFRFVNLPIWFYNKISKKRDKRLPFYRLFEYISRHSRNNILISGSIFMELHNVPFVVQGYYKNEEKYYDLNPHVIGCNFGPYYNDGFKAFYEKMFQKASYVCFREKKSYEMFSGENIHYAPDIVFTYPVPEGRQEDREHVLLSVMNVEKDGKQNQALSEAYIQEMVLLIEKLQEQDEKIVLLGFCVEQKDDVTIQSILNRLNSQKGIQSYCYPNVEYEKALELIQKAKSVVATRYHAMILGWLYGAKVLPIVYSDKMLNVINDLTPGTKYARVEDLDGSGIVHKLFEEMKGDANILDVSEVVTESQMNFKSLDKLFGKESYL